jgi:hypothetical protein
MMLLVAVDFGHGLALTLVDYEGMEAPALDPIGYMGV